MITADGYFDWARRDPGPSEKQYTAPCMSQGVINHSAVGYYNGWRSRLDDMSKDANGRFTPYAAASVTGWVEKDGTLIQHYPITASCWASGNGIANIAFNAFEHAGGPPGNESEPLTAAQKAADLRIIRDLMAHKKLTQVRRITELAPGPARGAAPAPIGTTAFWLGEHNEAVTLWGGAPTACPSKRIPWAEYLAALQNLPDGLSLVRSSAASYTFLTLALGGKRRWKVYIDSLAALRAVSAVVGGVVTIQQAELDAIPRLR
ncbi:MAG TPA: N-acetylmuramoyl-L-alanine amidase [Dehalococcoidia bacterium]|nr:N-acetylmuramoyl-L-alanine amidase [Dehalococcoidia bacterium]